MSFEVQTYRVGEESNPDGSQDPGVLALNASLVAPLLAANDTDVVKKVEEKLIEQYGAENVSTTEGTPIYIFVWGPDSEMWIKLCIRPTTVLVQDSSPKPVSVQISLRTIPPN